MDFKADSDAAKDGWAWYYSADGGERYWGPFPDRDAAIEIAKDDDLSDSIVICEGVKEMVRPISGGRLIEDFQDANEEVGDPEGDGILRDQLTREEEDELERRVFTTMCAYLEQIGAGPVSSSFAETRNEETISISSSGDSE